MLDPHHPQAPEWPAELARLLARRTAGVPAPDPALRRELWAILRTALLRALRRKLHRFSAVVPDDLEDLASQKALELLLRAESGEWEVSGRHPNEIAAYIGTVARNALLTHGDRRLRAEAWREGTVEELESAVASPASGRAEASEFVLRLLDCVGALRARSRRVWFLRVLHDMSSRDISAHPEIGLPPNHVDVIAKRAREEIRACLGRHGFSSQDLPAGAYVHVWNRLQELARTDADERRTGNDD